MKEPLTQNLGELIENAQRNTEQKEKSKIVPLRPELGIEIIQPSVPMQTSRKTGDKNIEAEGTAAKNTLNSAEKNKMNEQTSINGNINPPAPVSQEQSRLTPFEAWAMQSVSQVNAALGKIANQGVTLQMSPFERRNKMGTIIIGAGVGATVFGAAGACVAGLVPSKPSVQDVIMATAAGAGVGAVIGAAATAAYVSGEPKKKDEDKKA